MYDQTRFTASVVTTAARRPDGSIDYSTMAKETIYTYDGVSHLYDVKRVNGTLYGRLDRGPWYTDFLPAHRAIVDHFGL